MSETTNLKLFKHDNPSTNTNPFNVEQALNDNWNKIDTAVGDLQDDIKENNTNITNIDTRLTTAETDLGTAKTDITNIKAEQTTQNNNIEANSTAIETNAEAIEQSKEDITDLQEENADLRAQIPTGTAAGEEISLIDSAEMELVDFGLQGNSKQDGEPTLENPISVEAVGDNINLYPFEDIEFNSDETQELWCFINGQSGAYGKNLVDYTDYKITLEKGKYYFKLDTDDSNIITGGLVKNGETNEIELSNLNSNFEIKETTVCTLRLKVKNPSLGIKIKSIKLERGTEATPYSPYNQGNVEIVKSNKNLLNWLDILNKIGIVLPYSREVNGITFSIDENGKVSVKGTSTSTVQFYLMGSWDSKTVRYVIDNVANAIASGTSSDWSKGLTCTFLDNSGDTKVHLDFYNSKNNKCAKSKFNITAIIFSLNTGVTINETYNLQLEKGPEATEFIEHEGNNYIILTQKPLYKIGDYADRFIKQDEKWYEQHNIREYQITGNENWKLSKSNDEFYKYEWANGIADKLNVINTILMCSHFSQITVSQSDSLNVEGIANGSYPNYSLMIVSKQLKTLENFKSKLQELYNAGTPVKVYYVLATPELIECTEEQTQVLEQIVKDGTYKEITHFYTTDDLKPTIEVKYYKDLETLFNKQVELENTLNNVQAQILELGGK